MLCADILEQVLSISIYDPTWKIEESLGEHQRVTILPGPLDIDEVIRSEATAKFITDSKLKKKLTGDDSTEEELTRKAHSFTQAGGRTLVLSKTNSAANKLTTN